jgi:hypothetical protein
MWVCVCGVCVRVVCVWGVCVCVCTLCVHGVSAMCRKIISFFKQKKLFS